MTRLNIKKYQARIEKANAALNELPDTVYGWQQEMALNKERQALLDEISHMERLIKISKKALSDEG